MTISATRPSTSSVHRAWPAAAATLTIDHSALAHNLALVCRVSGVDVMAVVKADGFGLGAVQVARTMAAAGASSLGVTSIDEALALRRAGLTLPILAWLAHPGADLAGAIRSRIELSAATIEMVLAVSTAADKLGVTAGVHLEADTGLKRGGASATDWPELCRVAARLERAGSIRVVGVWSHLARAAHPHWSAVEGQVEDFQLAVGEAFATGLRPSRIHLANSGAALAHPRARFTESRSGAALFGIEPVEGREFGVRPVVRVGARILHVREVHAGDAVGYNAGWVAPGATRLGLVPIGYADGVPRTLSGTGWLSVRGRPCRIVGAISMDQLLVDLGDLDAQPGDEAVFLGDPAMGEPSLGEVAARAGTIPQEILTNLGNRFERIHRGAQNVA